MTIEINRNAIVTSKNPDRKILSIIKDLLYILPECTFFKKKNWKLKQILSYLKLRNYKNFLFIKKEKQNATILWHINFDSNSSIIYRIISFLPKENISNNSARSSCIPELVFKDFNGNIGKAMSFFLKSLFSGTPSFKSRQIISFHLHQKYIFLRFFRYIFSISGQDVRLQEIGPRFTLKFYKIYKSIPEYFFFDQ